MAHSYTPPASRPVSRAGSAMSGRASEYTYVTVNHNTSEGCDGKPEGGGGGTRPGTGASRAPSSSLGSKRERLTLLESKLKEEKMKRIQAEATARGLRSELHSARTTLVMKEEADGLQSNARLTRWGVVGTIPAAHDQTMGTTNVAAGQPLGHIHRA